MFHLLSLVSKTSTYDFYCTLERMSDNIGLNTLPSCGQAHDVTGPEGTKPGELAILCPSCPWPGINLPSDWDQVPPHLKFLYLLLICIDANFRLKNQIVSSYSRDPGLGIGWSYFTTREPYEDYVQSQATDADIEFSTVAKSNTKFSKGLRYTGVVAVSCGGSGMVLPTCVGNTDKGERISPLVPKFHEPGHKAEEHEQFSFNLTEGVDLLDGECPERIWVGHNALGNSTKTVGPGMWQDLNDDHLGFWNWVKYCCMGLTLWKRYKVAIMERNWQEEVHWRFTQSLLPDMVSEWDDLCVAWEADKVPKVVLNPFCVQSDDLTEDKVHKELAEEEEARRRSRGRAVHNMSPSAFMVFGLVLEESQRKLHLEIKKLKANLTAHQDAHIAEQRSLLQVKIKKFEELCMTYMPGLLQFVSETQEVDHSSAGTVAEEVQLWLPSSIPADRRGQVCGSLSDMEECLCTAQCHDALNSVRHILHLKMQMVEYKNKNMRGINAIHERALAAALKYRTAREAKLQLSGPGDWERTLHKLEDSNIRSYQDPDRLRRGTGHRGTNEDSWGPGSTPKPVEHGIDLYQDDCEKQDGTGQTWRTLSWIWTTMKINLEDGADENNDEVLHSE
ncbi:hypothetical protein ARMSODRAFT_989178 [Armillaria solidipes]|uniref:CxC2-like cysteine cluster KDZ transposase-associated domain-containing protein n=1 Tax=Armillaria solidipes TaxID=1076256 RepID=A0A2H3BWA0_9AGAR|nr:hypothetical protein ARMSODRAFT_989178 [Armillaria solidipes]